MSSVELASWGRYPYYPQSSCWIHWQHDIAEALSLAVESHGTTLAYGMGRSYGDSCLAASDNVLCMQHLDRFVSVNWETGVVVAEAGLTLAELLRVSIPRGWFLPVSPGTQYVTLGGAIANDVHGKNHHVRGTFGRHVKRLSLIRSDQAEVSCSPEENREYFNATVGGLGLTGIIATVELQLMPVRSSCVDTVSVRFESLDDFFSLCEQFDETHEYTVAWVDCLARGGSAGRGVFSAANHSDNSDAYMTPDRKKFTIPFTFPFSAVNRWTLKPLNTGYYHLHTNGVRKSVTDYRTFFYPLDRILHWNRAYGRQGFQQYQCVFPEDVADKATEEFLKIIAGSGTGSFLAVMKKCGEIASPGLLSFPMPGISLALDFPQREKVNAKLFKQLDLIVREAGGRLYPAKDAHMTGGDFRHFYPAWEKVERMRDPALCSRFWQRVTS